MAFSIADAVRQMVHNKGISEELVVKTVEEALLAAYKKKFGAADNAVCRMDEETGDVHLYAKKEVVEQVDDPLFEISIEDAKLKNAEVELQDEVLVEIMPQEFGRIDAQVAKQVVIQRLRDIEKNIIFNEYKEKEGEILTGVVQRERFGNIFVDLGRTEAILPKSEQSPKEYFAQGDRIKALILEVKDNKKGSSIILSRAHPDFVRRIFEIEVPEIADGAIEIKAIVRDPGFRTKIAVYAHDMDPVGACVGMKGIRIQTIVKELEGEKIDIVRYSDDIRTFIQNALSPAEIERIVILSEENKEAVAVVSTEQLSLAIGRNGQNVRLASQLVKWTIDVKSVEEFQSLGIEEESVALAHQLFEQEEERHGLELLELPENIIHKLEEVGIIYIEDLIDKTEDDLQAVSGIGQKTAEYILKTLHERVEVVSDEDSETEALEEQSIEMEEDSQVQSRKSSDKSKESEYKDSDSDEVVEEIVEYFCPICNHKLTEDMTQCPSCGAEFE